MEIVEAILKYFTDNSATLINIMLPILITFFVTMFFRKKDKKDNDARNLRAELREYFLTNCKPIIDEIVRANDQKFESYFRPTGENSKTIKNLQELFKTQKTLVFELPRKFILILGFVKNISHEEYKKRFENFYYMIYHITLLYNQFIGSQILSLDSTPPKQPEELNKLIQKIDNLIFYITLILAQSELMLFNYNFDKDDAIFQESMDELNNAILDTGLDNAEEFLCDKEKMKQFIKPGNKTTETK